MSWRFVLALMLANLGFACACWRPRAAGATAGALAPGLADLAPERPLPPGYPTMKELGTGGWLPVPRQPLPFPAIVAASHNDPLGAWERVAALGVNWGASIHDAGRVGHLNPPAGFGPWHKGEDMIRQLLRD